MEIRFKLNEKNEKDKVIIDILNGEYSPSETIKAILYKMGTSGLEGIPMLIGGYFKNTDLFNIRNETISENPPKVIECNKVSNEVREDDIEYDVDISEFNEFF